MWTVWGDQTEPVLEGTEQECKDYIINHPDRPDLYVTDPQGNDWEPVDGEWIQA